jgi:hypothetical protein
MRDQKYGALKHVVMSPWFQWAMEMVEDLLSIELMGEPRMATPAIVVLMYMLFKARQPMSVIALLAAFFFNIHPLAIVGAVAGVLTWARLRLPKGYDPARPPPRTAPFVNVRRGSLFCFSLLCSLFCGLLVVRLWLAVGRSLGRSIGWLVG